MVMVDPVRRHHQSETRNSDTHGYILIGTCPRGLHDDGIPQTNNKIVEHTIQVKLRE